ncbi:MAG: hypothetical protein ABRQ26_03105 [Syntrophomonadaceae bacterium]
MDRVVISAAISHLQNAKNEIDKMPRDRMDRQTLTQVENIGRVIDDSINHCQALFTKG